MSNLLGTGEAAEEALAVRLGVSVARLRAMLQRLEGRDVSLDRPSADRGGLSSRPAGWPKATRSENCCSTSSIFASNAPLAKRSVRLTPVRSTSSNAD